MAESISQHPHLGEAATTFINDHTIADNNFPLHNECPICLEEYLTEPCMRIIGIKGCNHHVGLDCLQEILRNNPGQEKKCPLCRTVWIAATSGPMLQLPQPDSQPRNMADMFEGLEGIGENITSRARFGLVNQLSNLTADRNTLRGNMHRLPPFFPRTQRDPSARSPILVDSDSEMENYETERANYERFTRELESIRSRARNTQLSRSQRRRELNDRQQNASSNGNQIPSVLQNNNSNNTAAARGDTSGGGGIAHLHSRIIEPFGHHNRTVFGPREERLRLERLNSPTIWPPGLGLRPAPSVVSSYSDRLTSSAAPTNMDDDEVIELPENEAQASLDAARTRHLQRRETALNDREKRLDERENAVLKRENEALQREHALRDRERRRELLVDMTIEQRDEIQRLLRRQTDDIERLVMRLE